MNIKTASEVFQGAAKPGQKVNSKTFSRTHSNVQTQVGGNRLTGAWHPQDTHSQDFSKHEVHAVRPTQQRIGATGTHGSVGGKVPFNNHNVRSLAGSPHSGTPFNLVRVANNSLTSQHSSRAVARGITGVDTTTRRGGSSVMHFAKPVAGTKSTYALPGVLGGRGNTQFIKVDSVHHFGLHKVVVTKHIAASPIRKKGAVS